MLRKKDIKFEVVPGHTEHITFGGKRIRRPTVLIRVGSLSFSKKAFLLGLALASCQVLDGLLTYVGLSLMGVHMEGNSFLRELMHAYGTLPTLFAVKCFAIIAVVLLAFHAHRRRWIRPLMLMLIVVYFMLAVLPWTYLISQMQAQGPEALPVVNSTVS